MSFVEQRQQRVARNPNEFMQRDGVRFLIRSFIFAVGLCLGVFVSGQAQTTAPGADSILLAPLPPGESTSDTVTVAALTAVAPATEEGTLPNAPSPTGQQQVASAAPAPSGGGVASTQDPLAQGRQTKRILFVVPNFRAVSADQQLPPQSVKEKLKTSLEDSFDYSSFIFVGAQAGIGQATNSYPYFGQGMRGYGRYYWHTLADAINENTWVEFIIPSMLHQDTRYYTLGKGETGKRAAYAVTRVFITRTDDGNRAFNFSEVLGAGTFAGIANLYYPSQERTLVKTYQRWVTNLAIDGGVFVFKEIWPDINNSFFHQKD